ncbi:hypothetical protein BHMPCIPO_04969 [Ensifer sesbaniae]|nr:hypothetical protein [Ensifer sesbaniae]
MGQIADLADAIGAGFMGSAQGQKRVLLIIPVVDDESSLSYRLSMRTSLEHLPEKKQRELARVVEIVHEEFADALEGGSADFKKRGRILKIILFGSYARGTFVDEPHTMKGYRSDYDILVIVNSKKLAEPQY